MSAAIGPEFETFLVRDSDGVIWHMVREPLGGGIYRTPDDPTSLQDLIDARIEAAREREIEELIASESGTTPRQA